MYDELLLVILLNYLICPGAIQNFRKVVPSRSQSVSDWNEGREGDLVAAVRHGEEEEREVVTLIHR